MSRMVPPPFRALDPELAAAERLLATGHAALCSVAVRLPDEAAAASRLNELLAEIGATPRLVADGVRWRIEYAAAAAETSALAAAAAGLAELVAADGWARVKRCATCGQVLCDRTNGRTRRWCEKHRPRAGRRGALALGRQQRLAP